MVSAVCVQCGEHMCVCVICLGCESSVGCVVCVMWSVSICVCGIHVGCEYGVGLCSVCVVEV